MRNKKTLFLAASTFLTGIIPLIAFNSRHAYYELVAGFSTLLFLLAAQELNRSVLEESISKKGKAYRDFIETVGLFTVIAAGSFAGIVPFTLSITVVAVLGATKIYKLELSKRFRQSFSFALGEKFWIGIIGAVYLAAYSNLYFLFYGYLLLTAVVLYDLSALFVELRERNRV